MSPSISTLRACSTGWSSTSIQPPGRSVARGKSRPGESIGRATRRRDVIAQIVRLGTDAKHSAAEGEEGIVGNKPPAILPQHNRFDRSRPRAADPHQQLSNRRCSAGLTIDSRIVDSRIVELREIEPLYPIVQ